MRIATIAAGSLAALGIAIAAQAGAMQDRPERKGPPVAVPDGKPVSCIPLNRIRQTKVHSDDVIDFVMNDRTVYRNTLPTSCPRLSFEQRFSHRSPLNEYCSGEIITVLMTAGAGVSGLQGGPSCQLGMFQPVKLPTSRRR